jgi:hypothetical protein
MGKTTAAAVHSSLETPILLATPSIISPPQKKRRGRPPKHTPKAISSPPKRVLTAKERYWSEEECRLFEYLYFNVVDQTKPLVSLQISKLMAEAGFNRTVPQIRTHTQKWLIRITKTGKLTTKPALPLNESDFAELNFSPLSEDPFNNNLVDNLGVATAEPVPHSPASELASSLYCSESIESADSNLITTFSPLELLPLPEGFLS